VDAEREGRFQAQAALCLDEFRRGFTDGDCTDGCFQIVDVEFMACFLAALEVNAMVVADEELRSIGLGLYLQAATFNHDEDPNCAHSFVGRRLLVRTVRTINAGEELTIAYAELAELSSARQARLRAQYFFDPLPKGLLPDSVARRDKLLAEVLERSTDGRLEPGGWWAAMEFGSWCPYGCHNGAKLYFDTGTGGPQGLGFCQGSNTSW